MAKKKIIANDPQEEKKLLTTQKTINPEGANKVKNKSTESIPEPSLEKNESSTSKEKETKGEEKIDYNSFSIIELVSELEKLTKQDNWFNQTKNIQEITHQFETKFKNEIQIKKEEFIKEGGNEIDFYFRPSHKNEFDQIIKDHKKKKRSFFQEREKIK